MECIFHEKQEGALCAQHCLNSLLQGPYYTAVDLATLAKQLDEAERVERARAGDQDANYQRFLNEASANMDDTGFFSVQVITSAIAVWGLDMVNFNSSSDVAIAARQNPVTCNAFICNFREHWLTIRRLGTQWFNLNSLLTGPELISNTYLSLTLAQLQQDGYSIYIVTGSLPDCQADQILRISPVVQSQRPPLLHEQEGQAAAAAGATGAGATASALSDEDEELQRALQLSAVGHQGEDEDLKLALQLSQQSMSSNPQSADVFDASGIRSEEDDIQRAIQMSLKREAEKLTTKLAAVEIPPATQVRPLRRPLLPPSRVSASANSPSKTLAKPSLAPRTISSNSNPVTAPVNSERRFGQLSSSSASSPPASESTTSAMSSTTPTRLTSSNQGVPYPKSGPLLQKPPSTQYSRQVKAATFSAERPPPRAAVDTPAASASPPGLQEPQRLDGRSQYAPQSSARAAADPEEVRRKRMAFLDKMEAAKKE